MQSWLFLVPPVGIPFFGNIWITCLCWSCCLHVWVCLSCFLHSVSSEPSNLFSCCCFLWYAGTPSPTNCSSFSIKGQYMYQISIFVVLLKDVCRCRRAFPLTRQTRFKPEIKNWMKTSQTWLCQDVKSLVGQSCFQCSNSKQVLEAV